MKKLLVLIGALAAFGVSAQPLTQFRSYQALNVTTLTVTNGRGYTNPAAYFGQLTPSTNTTGMVYTNLTGSVLATGTNDTTTFFKDIPLDLNPDGSIRTNLILSYAATFGPTTSGMVEVVLSPILKGPLQPTAEPGLIWGSSNTINIAGTTFLNISNTIVTYIPVTTNAGASASINISLLGLPATSVSKGLRVTSLMPTNVTGSITLYDLSRSAYVP